MKETLNVRGLKENVNRVFSFINDVVFKNSNDDKVLSMTLKIVCEEIFMQIVSAYSPKIEDIEISFEFYNQGMCCIKFIYGGDKKDVTKSLVENAVLNKLINKIDYSYENMKNCVEVTYCKKGERFLKISEHDEGEKVFLELEGRIDTNTSQDLDDKFKEIFTAGKKFISVNVEKVDYISSTGLRAFLTAQKSINKLDGEMVLENMSDAVYSVFQLTGFSSIVKIKRNNSSDKLQS